MEILVDEIIEQLLGDDEENGVPVEQFIKTLNDYSHLRVNSQLVNRMIKSLEHQNLNNYLFDEETFGSLLDMSADWKTELKTLKFTFIHWTSLGYSSVNLETLDRNESEQYESCDIYLSTVGPELHKRLIGSCGAVDEIETKKVIQLFHPKLNEIFRHHKIKICYEDSNGDEHKFTGNVIRCIMSDST